MFNRVDYVMIMVSNMSRSVQFYRDTLGIPLKFESPDWTEFDTGDTVLALHGGGKLGSQPKEPSAGTASIGFHTANVEEKYLKLKQKGVIFTMPPTERKDEGIKLAVCLDPDGLPISIAESRQK